MKHPLFIVLPILLIVAYIFGIQKSNAMPVILWTDALIYILVLAISGFVVYAMGKEHLRDPWRQVFQHRLGMVSLVVLVIYVTIGLLDSVHFRLPVATQQQTQTVAYSGDVLSVLDLLIAPIREQDEKTYSAPFATHLFSKETVENEDGSRTREFPRLVYGGAHLENPETDKISDIFNHLSSGVLIGVGFWAILCNILLFMIAHRRKSSMKLVFMEIYEGRSEVPWRLILFTVALVCILVGILMMLAPKYHVLGTDKVGQDVLYQAIKSIRTGLVIGTLTTLIMLPFAVMLGLMAGYLKGWIDDVIQYLYTTLSSIPGVLLIAAAVLMMQVYMANHPELFETDAERADIRLFFLCLILGVTSWTGLCRMLRGETLKLSEVDYVQASQAFGVSKFNIIWRHIQPNVMHIILIAIVLDFSGLVLAEAVLSYIGIGVDPTMHSWGNLINGARLEMAREPMVWWSLLAAFIFMFILVLAANLFSDAVRDAFDPRIRKQ